MGSHWSTTMIIICIQWIIIFLFWWYLIFIVKNDYIVVLFCKSLFGDHRWGVDALFHIYHMTSFNYDAKGAKDVGLSCRCHPSNSQIAKQYARENNLLVIVCKCVICCCCYCFVFLNSVFLLVFRLGFVFFFSGFFTEYLSNWSSRV